MSEADLIDGETRTIQTNSGPILVKTTTDLLYARNVPFAQAERFQLPKETPAWTETKDCTKAGANCPQLPFRFEFVLGAMTSDQPQLEDCLNLTVTSPLGATSTSKLPVLVWYHGGANIAGGADVTLMDLSNLARGGVIAVGVQYRLGVFGCLEIDGIAPANLHTFDQIAALRWVHNNIASFGGDPSQITIMGQSAGGWAVHNMLLAEGTAGLFQRAVIISAPIPLITGSSSESKTLARRTRELLQGEVATMSTSDLLDVQKTLLEEQAARGGVGKGFGPVWGKSPLPKAADISAKLAEVSRRVELFVGWAADDCLPFVQLTPWGKWASELPVVGSTIALIAGKIATAVLFKRPAQLIHHQWTKSGGKSTSFSFEWFPPGSVLRACHCIEMPFLFGGWASWAAAPLVAGPGSQEIVERLGPKIRDTFITFVREGLPDREHITFDERFAGLPRQSKGI